MLTSIALGVNAALIRLDEVEATIVGSSQTVITEMYRYSGDDDQVRPDGVKDLMT